MINTPSKLLKYRPGCSATAHGNVSHARPLSAMCSDFNLTVAAHGNISHARPLSAMCSDFNLTVAAHGKHSHTRPLSAMYSNLEPNSGRAWEHFPCAAAVR